MPLRGNKIDANNTNKKAGVFAPVISLQGVSPRLERLVQDGVFFAPKLYNGTAHRHRSAASGG